MCKIPSVVDSCPTAAIRPATVDGKPSVEVDEDLCMYCANCFSVCPSLPIADPLNLDIRRLAMAITPEQVADAMFDMVSEYQGRYSHPHRL